MSHTASDEALELEAALKKLPNSKRRASEGQAVRVLIPTGLHKRRPEKKGRARVWTMSSQSARDLLANVPESNSAITSDGSESESSNSDHDMDDDDDDDEDQSYGLKARDKGRGGLVRPSHKDEPESEYPSPAETVDSPQHEPDFFVQDQTMAELQSILTNDPCHLGPSSTGSLYAPAGHHDEDAFHYQLGLSIEGPMPDQHAHAPVQQSDAFPTHALYSFDELLRAAQRHPHLGHGAQAAREVAEAARYAPPGQQQQHVRLPISLPLLAKPAATIPIAAPTMPLASPTLIPVMSNAPKKFDFNAAFKEHQRLSQLAREREHRQLQQQQQHQQQQPTGQSQLSPQSYTTNMFQQLDMSHTSPIQPAPPSLPSPSLSFPAFPNFGALPSPAPSLASFSSQACLPNVSSTFASLGITSNSLGLSIEMHPPNDGAGESDGYTGGVPSTLSLSLPWAPDATVAATQERALLEEYMKRCGAPVQVQVQPSGKVGRREKKGRARVEHIEHAAMYLPASG